MDYIGPAIAEIKVCDEFETKPVNNLRLLQNSYIAYNVYFIKIKFWKHFNRVLGLGSGHLPWAVMALFSWTSLEKKYDFILKFLFLICFIKHNNIEYSLTVLSQQLILCSLVCSLQQKTINNYKALFTTSLLLRHHIVYQQHFGRNLMQDSIEHRGRTEREHNTGYNVCKTRMFKLKRNEENRPKLEIRGKSRSNVKTKTSLTGFLSYGVNPWTI